MHPTKTEAPCISIIIPSYNNAHLLGRAVRSCLSTNCQNIEVIVVDDKSNDGSRETIKKLATSDDRVKFILLEENGGPLNARLLGVDEATSDLITFLDADDELIATDLMQLIVEHKEQNIDITVGGYIDIYTGKTRSLTKTTLSDKAETIDFLISTPHRYMWSKIYKRSLYQTLRTEIAALPFRHCEDVLVNYLFYTRVDKLKIQLHEVILTKHNYISESISRTKKFDNFLDAYRAILWMKTDMENNNYHSRNLQNYFFSKLFDLATTDDSQTPKHKSYINSESKKHAQFLWQLSFKNRLWLLLIMRFPSSIRIGALIKKHIRLLTS